MKIPLSFYSDSNVVFIAKSLIGKFLFTKIEGKISGGMITETEAYAGISDRASHAFGERRTQRTKVMYYEGGVSYVYLCYGVHYLFNVVTGKKEEPHAVLIRAIYPTFGLDLMMERTGHATMNYNQCNGPGKLTKILGITQKFNGLKLDGDMVWIEDLKSNFEKNAIHITERIGVQYAGDDSKLPYRFLLKPENLPKKRASD